MLELKSEYPFIFVRDLNAPYLLFMCSLNRSYKFVSPVVPQERTPWEPAGMLSPGIVWSVPVTQTPSTEKTTGIVPIS